jgi:hypothetical protein
MTLSDFVLVKRTGSSPIDWVYVADVTVFTRHAWLWWICCTERRAIARKFAGSWYFVDTGQYCPGFQAEALERSDNARRAMAR